MGERVLIVDDDEKLRTLLREYLEDNMYQVTALSDGSNLLETVRSKLPDIIILDIMLPGKDGLELLKDLRREFATPVIMLTAKGEDMDRILGLELGADDYLPKPFNPRELLARMKAIWRRTFQDMKDDIANEKYKNLIVRAGGLELNRAKQIVILEGEEIELSSTEFKLLEVLMERPNKVLNRDQLMSMARGREFMAFDRSIDVHISKLRSKLEVDPRSPKRIKTVWGTGYMFLDN
jgi:two-component system phosphate regulon response regulator OmpR